MTVIGQSGGASGNDITVHDGRVILTVNKVVVADTGATQELHPSELVRAFNRNVVQLNYFSPTPSHAYGWDNLFCVDTETVPPFFYCDVQPVSSVVKGEWARSAAANTLNDDLQTLRDDDDATYLWSNDPNDPLIHRFAKSDAFDGRLSDEIVLYLNMSRGDAGLSRAEVVATDGVTVFGTNDAVVAGQGAGFVEQEIRVKLSQLKDPDLLDLQLFTRSV